MFTCLSGNIQPSWRAIDFSSQAIKSMYLPRLEKEMSMNTLPSHGTNRHIMMAAPQVETNTEEDKLEHTSRNSKVG